MKIAVFYPPGGAAWSVSMGLSVVLARMGHEVTDVANRLSPSRDILEEQDVLFVGGPEYRYQTIRSEVPSWDSIKKTKIGWLHETVEREDYPNRGSFCPGGKLPIDELKAFTPNLFTPASQDECYGMKFIPLGVDTEMFKPSGDTKVFPVLFMGYLYPKRTRFLIDYPEVARILTHPKANSTEDYAALTSKAKVVLNIPSMSELNNARVYETMACKTALVTPIMAGPENYTMFEDGKHLLYFAGDPMPAINRLLKGDYLREQIAEQGYQEIHAKHKLEYRLQKMLEMSV